MNSPAPGISGIGQIALRVNDLDAAVAFYRDVLGLEFLFRAPPGLAFFQCGGTRLMLSNPEASGANSPSFALYYSVKDIQAAARALESRGGKLEEQPHIVAKLPHAEVWIAFARDADGNLAGLISEVPTGSPSHSRPPSSA
jgi:methylmalonyl-CoA/ethylmalonyl-CoA epimerase